MAADKLLGEKYRALLGDDATDEEIMELYRVAEVLQISPMDSVWTIIFALRYYQTLYKQIPGQIAQASAKTCEQVRSAADKEIELAVAKSQKKLADVVVKSAETIAVDSTKKYAARWISVSVISILLSLLVVGFSAFWAGKQSGQAAGFASAREEAAAASWAATEAGAAAYRLYLAGSLPVLTGCSQPGWERSGDFCYPHPDRSSGQQVTYGWKLK